ncbi:hypothetical protein BGX26_011434 [Mortierella sp. AD094]|nr:hypothetical protein BGX26_011434 [Mortierella sp. AD094]
MATSLAMASRYARTRSKRNDDGDGTSCRRDTVFHLSPMREDVYIRGRDNMTQNDIQRMLVKRFGKKQNKHNMTIVMINEIDPSSRGLCNK